MESRNDELMHWGVLGMKWGVRRYQNADGTLTAAGKKRYGTKANFEKVQRAKKAASPDKLKKQKAREKANARTEAEIAKYKKKAGIEDNKKESTNNSTEINKTKSIKEMSNAEIQARIDRIRLEQTLASLQPKKVSAGEKFIKNLSGFATKTLSDVSQKVINKAIENAFKEQKVETAYDKLKKENDMLNEQKRKMEYEDFLNNYTNDQANKRYNESWRSMSTNATNKHNTWSQNAKLWEEQKAFYEKYGDTSFYDFTNAHDSTYGKDYVDAEFMRIEDEKKKKK